MHRRSLALLLSLVVLFFGMLAWVLNDGAGKEQKIETRETTLMKDRREIGASRLPSAAESERISRRGWMPPLVFQEQGEAVVPFPFPRGVNHKRRFAEPTMRVLAAASPFAPPVVLAGLPEDGRTHLLPEEIDQFTLRGYRLAFLPASIESVLKGETTRILVPSVSDEVVELSIDSVKSRDVLTHTLFGNVVGEEETSTAQLVYHDGVLHGNVVRYMTGQELEYRILADGHLMVRELDQLAMTDPCGAPQLSEDVVAEDEPGAPDPDAGEQGVVEGDTAGFRTLDVVVGYGKEARQADGGYSGIEARIIGSVDRMNQAFSNSQIGNAEVMLLGTIEDPDYDFPGQQPGKMGEELGNLNSTSDGVLDTVSDYRAELGADFVSFVVKQPDGSAGIAYQPGRDSITSRTYMTGTRITFVHELGHNLGCDHSWGDSTQSYHSDYGWRLDPPDTTRVRTIMAYDWGWGNGHRIPYFANPNVLFNGARTGAVAGYDVRGDSTGDQRYAEGGLGYNGSDSTRIGFNGTIPELAATNANTVDTGSGSGSRGIGPASNRSTRTNFNVVSPVAGARFEIGSVHEIFFTGGDKEDQATIQLFRGAQLVATLGSNLNPATERLFSWTIGSELIPATDYLVRVLLVQNGVELSADSGLIEILPDTPRVVSHSPDSNTGTTEAVADLRLTFNRPMNPSSFSFSSDVLSFIGPGGVDLAPAITGGSWSESNTVLTVSFARQSVDGRYELLLAPAILDTSGNQLDQDIDAVTGEVIQDRYLADFEILSLGGSLDAPGFVWTTTGDATWFPQKQVNHDGVDAAQSGNVGDNQSSSLETTVTGPGTLSFWWKIDSENNYDWLEFYLDGILQTGDLQRISGDVDWQQKTVSIPAGTQTIRWTFDKDGSVTRGADAAWLDEVVYTPDSTTLYRVSFFANGSTGGGAPGSVTQLEGFNLSIPGNTGGLVKEGFSFVGWNTREDGNGIDYLPGTSYLMVANLDLFAKWNALPVSLAGEDQTILLQSGAGWSPVIFGAQAWYDASDSASFEVAGDLLSRWVDKTGNGRDATQDDDGARPAILSSGFNDQPVVFFDGADDFLNVDLDYLAGTSHSAFVVTKTNTYSNIYGAAGRGQGSNSLHMGFRSSTQYRTNYWGNDYYASITDNFDRDGGNVLNFIWRENVGKEVFANGWSEGSNSSAGVIGMMSGGGRFGRVTDHPFYGGEIAEMIFFTGDLSVEQRRTVEGYLAHKWGVAGRLPSGHPFEESGPDGEGVTVELQGGGTDDENDSLTYLWTLESGPQGATVRFNDPSLAKPEATFSVAGTYVLRLTVSDGFGERFDEVTMIVEQQTIYEEWAGGSFTEQFVLIGPEANPDGDRFNNLQEFAFGMDPTEVAAAVLDYSEYGGVSVSGPPVVRDFSPGGTFDDLHVVFARRKDFAVAGLTYTVEFTHDLEEWTTSSTTALVRTDGSAPGEMEVVSVPFPSTVNLAAGGTGAPLYFRVGVSMPE